MTVNAPEQIETLSNTVLINADATQAVLKKCIAEMSAVQFFAAMKFDKIGAGPISGKAQNIIEQVNQMYSDLVVLTAAKNILNQYPGMTLELQLGSSSGYDIESSDGLLVAECFAVTTVSNNKKLSKDCIKLMQSNAPIKCIYFYTHEDSEEKLQKLYTKYPEIKFDRVFFDI